MNYFRGVGMFGSAFLGAHLMRGAAAAALLAWAIVHQTIWVGLQPNVVPHAPADEHAPWFGQEPGPVARDKIVVPGPWPRRVTPLFNRM